ncbi:MAG: chemotaxis protein CheW [Betaproteobacteria bacterium]|nr:chemotaxis protein CheW [Betaproteobacteria bacterium]
MPTMPSPARRFPDSPREREVLHRRAVRLACEQEREREAPAGELFLSVRLGTAERYGIPYAQVDEIVRPRGLTPVPCTPPVVAGVLSRRGQLTTVLSLRQMLPMEGRDAGAEEGRVVVVRAAGMTVGLLVDDVDGHQYWQAGHLTPALPSPGILNPAWILGIHDGTTALLNLDALIKSLSIEERS